MQPTNHAATTYRPLRYITAPAARCRFSTVRLGASRRVGLRVRAEAEPSSLLPPPAFPKFPCLASNSRNPKASGPNQTLRASARAPTRDIAKFHVPGRQRPTGMIRIPRGSARGAHAARPPPVNFPAILSRLAVAATTAIHNPRESRRARFAMASEHAEPKQKQSLMDKAKEFVVDKIAHIPKPEASLDSVSFKSMSRECITLHSNVNISNPYDHRLPICEVTYTLKCAGKVDAQINNQTCSSSQGRCVRHHARPRLDRRQRQHQAGDPGQGALRLPDLDRQGRGQGLGHRLRAPGGAHHRPPHRRQVHHPALHQRRVQAPNHQGHAVQSHPIRGELTL
uniref:Uncharacterized protein n=1 Tax=Setaria italica TaxID=4555 RepID=K3Z7S1_SETIT